MKKNLLLIAALALGAVSFTSCGSDSDGDGGSGLKDVATMESAGAFEIAPVAGTALPGGKVGSLVALDATPTAVGKGMATLTFTPGAPAPASRARVARVEDEGKDYLVANYTYSDGTYNVEGYGKISIKPNAEGKLVVSVTPTGGEEVTTSATAIPVVTALAIAKQFSGNWVVAKTAFSYVEQNADGTLKPAVGAQFPHGDLVKMGEWLYDNEDVDIREDLGKKGAIELVKVSPYGEITIKFTSEESVGRWTWNTKTNSIEYVWDSEDMQNNFEDGTIAVSVSDKFVVFTLQGNLKDNKNSEGKNYSVKLNLTLKRA